jgi:hypothetical protein
MPPTDLALQAAWEALPCISGSLCDNHAAGSAQGWAGHHYSCPASHRPAVAAALAALDAFAARAVEDTRIACADACRGLASSGENEDDWTLTRDVAFHRCAEVILALGDKPPLKGVMDQLTATEVERLRALKRTACLILDALKDVLPIYNDAHRDRIVSILSASRERVEK